MYWLVAQAVFRFVGRAPVAASVALLGTSLAVASVVAVHVVSSAVAHELERLVPAPLSNYQYFVSGPQMQVSDYALLRGLWRNGAIPDVEALMPVIDERVVLAGQRVRVLGIDLLQADLSALQIARSGQGTQQSVSFDGVWLSADLKDLQVAPVNGVAELPSATLLADLGTAVDLTGIASSHLSYVLLATRSAEQAWPDVANQLFPGFSAAWSAPKLEIQASRCRQPGNCQSRVAALDVTNFEQMYPAVRFGQSVLFNVSALSILSLLVACFLIYQVASAWLLRLNPVFDRLFLVGVPRHVSFYLYLATLFANGLVAALAGFLLGQLLAETLLRFSLPGGWQRDVLDFWVIAKALGSGLAVSVASGWVCWLRQAAQPSKGLWLIYAVFAVAVFLSGLQPQMGLLGAFASLAMLALILHLIVHPALRIGHRISVLVRRVPALLLMSARDMLWHPRDLAIALSGLSLAMATAIGVGLMVDSFRKDFSEFLEQRLSYDVVVSGPTTHLNQARQNFAAAGIKAQWYWDSPERIQGHAVTVTATALNALELARYDVPFQSDEAGVLINEQLASLLQWAPGDVVQVLDRSARVIGVMRGFSDVGARMVVPDSWLPSLSAALLTSGALNLPGSFVKSEFLEQQRTANPNVEFAESATVFSQALVTFDRTFDIAKALTTIAMIVASAGLLVALNALRLARQTTSKLMLLMGLNKLELLGIDFARSVTVGVVACTLSVPTGLVMGWVLCHYVNPLAFGWQVQFQPTLPVILWPCLTGLLASVVAGLIRPGRMEEGRI